MRPRKWERTASRCKSVALLKPTGPVEARFSVASSPGVGSTVDKKSQKVYKDGKKYNEWEFIWNPLEDQAAAISKV